MLNQLKALLSEYALMPVTKENYADLLEVFETNQDFFLIEEGLTKNKGNACAEDIWALAVNCPPHISPSDKFCVGIWKDGKPIAILDYLVEAQIERAYLSLLIINGDYKRQQIGVEITNAFIAAARICGYKMIGLGVAKKNTDAQIFWEKLGFIMFREHDGTMYYNLTWDE